MVLLDGNKTSEEIRKEIKAEVDIIKKKQW